MYRDFVSSAFFSIRSGTGQFHKSVRPLSETTVGPFPEMQTAEIKPALSLISAKPSLNASSHSFAISELSFVLKNFCVEQRTSPFREIIPIFSEVVPMSAQRISVSSIAENVKKLNSSCGIILFLWKRHPAGFLQFFQLYCGCQAGRL